MNSKNLYALLAILVFSAFLASAISASLVSAATVPSKLQVYVAPPKVLADNGVYDCILVQLQDSKGVPARALEDVVVKLSSSRTDIGSVEPTVTIRSGETYARVRFFSTYTAGSTTITAIASGYTSGQAAMSTVGPIPSKIAVYTLPQTVPADAQEYDSVIVQLQDSGGTPARAPIGDVNVTLASSNVTVGTVDPMVTIQSGKTYVTTKFYTTNSSGSTTITAIAPGYASGQATVKTVQTGGEPSELKVYVGPPKVSAEGISYDSICIQLVDSQDKIARATGATDVTLASSDVSVGTVDSVVTIQSNKTYKKAKFYSTYKSGNTVITAIAPNYTSGNATAATVGPIPSKIAVYPFPPDVPADKDVYSVMVQLQDSAGNPARDPIGDVTAILSSSNSAVGNVDPSVVIPFGAEHVETKFYSSYKAGSTTITAAASGYASGQATAKSYIIDPLLTVKAAAYPDSIESGGDVTIRINVTQDTLKPPPPVPGATIDLASDKGGSFSSITDERNGYYSVVFKAPTVDVQTVFTITVSASKTGYASGDAQVKVTVNPVGPGGTIVIQVKSSEGNPISGATVLATSRPSGQPPLNGTTNNEGKIEFKTVKAGSYSFLVDKAGFEMGRVNATAVDGQTISTSVSLTAASTPAPSEDFLSSTYMWIIVIVVVVAVALATILLLRWRSNKSKRKLPTASKR
jgi:hypothetical protein